VHEAGHTTATATDGTQVLIEQQVMTAGVVMHA
jgi:hypothetical protein